MEANWREHIVATPEVLDGKPRVRGTRIPVSLILGDLAARYSYGNFIFYLCINLIVDQYLGLCLKSPLTPLYERGELPLYRKVLTADSVEVQRQTASLSPFVKGG